MRYAVICSQPLIHQGKYQFTNWHESFLSACEEAERLCKKEQKEFIVVLEVARVKIQAHPVIWEEIS